MVIEVTNCYKYFVFVHMCLHNRYLYVCLGIWICCHNIINLILTYSIFFEQKPAEVFFPSSRYFSLSSSGVNQNCRNSFFLFLESRKQKSEDIRWQMDIAQVIVLGLTQCYQKNHCKDSFRSIGNFMAHFPLPFWCEIRVARTSYGPQLVHLCSDVPIFNWIMPQNFRQGRNITVLREEK